MFVVIEYYLLRPIQKGGKKQMKTKRLMSGIIAVVLGMFMTGLSIANADTEPATEIQSYTAEDIKNLHNFLISEDSSDSSEKDYDLNHDDVQNVVDLCMMKQQYIKSQENEIAEKTLVAYYSASGTTGRIAEYIAEEMNADIFVITPKEEYTDADLNWTNPDSRVVQEHNNPDTRHVELTQVTPDNFDEYDNVFIGYPIWWQEAAWVVDDFVKENDFTGKNVIPFCTSMSSPLGQSGNKLSEMAGTGNWFEGMRFTSRSSETDVKECLSNLNLPYKENKNNILQFDDVDTFTSNITINRIKKIA